MITFGNSTLTSSLLASLKEFPVSPSGEEEIIVLDLLLLELKLSAGHPVEQARLKKLQAYSESDFIPKLFKNLVKPEIEAISAIMKHDQVILDLAMTKLVEGHLEEARVGELRKLTRGIMSFSGLMLSKISFTSEMQCNTSSE
ncbi:hypothetical protein MNBD_GAMMA21-138 [hydrothermal vent metagenome]|uniref:Uncharacterized protein n=1 Tax=hydrothermal vent metagenome TaxID=652676 RepID=A0A3B1A2K8_9ZZZZ